MSTKDAKKEDSFFKSDSKSNYNKNKTICYPPTAYCESESEFNAEDEDI